MALRANQACRSYRYRDPIGPLVRLRSWFTARCAATLVTALRTVSKQDLFLSWRSFVACALRARQQRTPKGQLSWGSDCLYACGFRIYFTPLPGFFSPFPHGTGSLSVDYEYLALEDGPPIFRQDFTCPALLLSRLVPHSPLRLRGFHPLRPAFPDRSPEVCAKSRRLLPFRSPLLWESRLISVPPATEMFQFTGFPTLRSAAHRCSVARFGDLRIKVC